MINSAWAFPDLALEGGLSFGTPCMATLAVFKIFLREMADFGNSVRKYAIIMLSMSIDAEYTTFITKFQ